MRRLTALFRRPSSVVRPSSFIFRPLSFFLRPSSFVLLFFWKLAFTHLILARGDAFLYFYPYWDYRARALLSGHLPLWNPYLFMGAPFLANSQAGVLYPLNWPLIFFSAPVAVKISILIHLLITATGTYFFARRALGQSPLGALLSAILFSLGGYLTAQVEHINQLQALAWFPWLLFSIHQSITTPQSNNSTLHPAKRPSTFRSPPSTFHFPPATFPLLTASLLFSLQLLAGHTQSAFISLVGVGLYALILFITQQRSISDHPSRAAILRLPSTIYRPSSLVLRPWSFVSFILFSFLLASAQLLPTLELSQQSLRSGGLPLREALSFSLDPRLLGRALLPGYSRGLFSEFVAYLGLVGLTLAAFGIKKTPTRLALLALALLGLVFALGAYNPLYALLAAFPPFNLFRVPARWLSLFAFGGALLAGHGLDDLSQRRRLPSSILLPACPEPAEGSFVLDLWPFALGLFLIFLSPLANPLIPAGETGPLGPPAVRDLAGWLLPLILLAALTFIRLPDRWRAFSIFLLATLELFCAAQILPYNHLTPPEAYTSIRPAMTQLLASTSSSSSVPSVDPRFLSMSALRFDPGDLAELHSELDPQLPPDAVYDAIVATKNKEVLSPNLPLAWNVPAVDGYDGGLLPLKHYAAFTELFTGSLSADGRLRENLTAAPDPRLLSLVNARYLITDKVDDAWIDNVFYDRQFMLTLKEGEQFTIAYVPKFQATALGLVADSFSGHIRLTFTDSSSSDFIRPPSSVLRPSSFVFHLDHPSTPTSITLLGPLTARGLSLIDERSGAFQSLTLGPYRLVHSGDVKIYDNLNVLPRAFVVPEAVIIADDSAARMTLADPNFDPASTVILASTPEVRSQKPEARSQKSQVLSPKSEVVLRPSSVVRLPSSVVFYAPELIQLTASGPGYLLLTDAYYPGWVATVDDAPAPILRADLMFRAVELPPGSHVIEFRFEPRSVKVGLWVSGVTWVIVLVFWILVGIKNKKAGG
jgi:hypothetical protein